MAHFDYIIANPPYEIGNQITSSVIESVDFDNYINLMPVSKYECRQLYKNVSAIESAEDAFEDAAVGDSLTIAVMNKNANIFNSYQELELMKVNPEYVDFYRLNINIEKSFTILPNMLNKYNIEENKNGFDTATDFLITTRTTQDGVHQSTDCHDYKFNILKQKTSTLAYMIRFADENTKNNFCNFWYNNPLMHSLIKGLNKNSGSCYQAIPNIDWSKERDYEHLTLDDIMQILREENPDVA